MKSVIAIGVLAAAVCLRMEFARAAEKPEAPKPAKKPARAKAKRRVPPVLKPIRDVEGLPRVLLIGDSISMGYTLEVRRLLKGQANVHRIPTNGGPTSRGLAQLDDWLGKGKWDVIHFNWGLHDLKYMKADGKAADPNSPDSHQQVPPKQYAKNMRELIGRLKKTGATLIWTTTTPVPAGSAWRVKGDAAKYNAIALKVVKAAGDVAVDDLYALVLPQLDKIQRPKNVHFRPEGSKVLARQVANSLLKALGKPELKEPESKPKGK